MEHIDVSNLSLATLGTETFRFVFRTTDLKDPVFTGFSPSEILYKLHDFYSTILYNPSIANDKVFLHELHPDFYMN